MSDMNSPWVPAAASLERLLDCTGEREQTLLDENGHFAAAHASRQCLTLAPIGIPRSTFYDWYSRYQVGPRRGPGFE